MSMEGRGESMDLRVLGEGWIWSKCVVWDSQIFINILFWKEEMSNKFKFCMCMCYHYPECITWDESWENLKLDLENHIF